MSYTIQKKDLFDLFGRLSAGYTVFVPYRSGALYYFGEFDARKEALIDLGGIRQSEPFKSFISSAREKVFKAPAIGKRPAIVAGVKACDLESLKIQDYVFLGGDSKDPFYLANRQNIIIIASDCTEAKETCFCMAMGGVPYPRGGFDISLSAQAESFIVEEGSAKGIGLINEYKSFFKSHSPEALSARESARSAVSDLVKNFIAKRETPDRSLLAGRVKKEYDAIDFWKDMASTCVECGACNLVCPTCHCFMLFDMKESGEAKRYRIWDSCLYNTFATVAGGANPRRHLFERLRNRFDKKFDYFPQVADTCACTGCGRCIEACAGDIDIREVLKGLVTGRWKKPPHD